MTLLMTLSSFLSDVSSWSMVVVGIGLVIFVHEAGHFMVAKWCGVRCEVFSLGFGPRLLGFRRGNTDYRLSLVPIGGYVKMAGDNPGENLQGASDELPNKSVGQRFAIYSAGVVMNVLFAMIALPIVLAIGVMFNSTEVGTVVEGGAAWRAGLRTGDDLLEVGDSKVFNFPEVVTQVALGDTENIPVVFQRPGVDEPMRTVLHPTYDEEEGRYVIGIAPAMEPFVLVQADGPAAAMGITDEEVRVLSFNGRALESVGDFRDACLRNEAEEVTLLLVLENGEQREVRVEAKAAADDQRRVGIQPLANELVAMRGSALELLGALLQEGDDLRRLWIHDAADPVNDSAAFKKPLRNRKEMEQAFDAAWDTEVRWSIELSRDGQKRMIELPRERLVAATSAKGLIDDLAFGLGDDQNMVWSYRGRDGSEEGTVFSAEQQGLPEWGRILAVDGEEVETWVEITEAIRAGGDLVTLSVEVDGSTQDYELEPRLVTVRPDVGLLPVYAMIERRYGIVEAFQVGVTESAYFLKTVYLTLKKIFVRDVSPKNLGGILTIAVVSKRLADAGIPRLFFFLAILSLNLAFLNILPIPVLDGGHLLFLLVEKIKGSPVSERVMGYSQLVGLVMVFALLLYVTYNDILRVFVKN